MTEQRRARTWIAPAAIIALGLVALGLLGAGVYAVFNSTNGAGTAALLTVGSLTLFLAVYHNRIRSMEFGGAKVQFAREIKDRLKEAFELRLAGNYEQAADKIEFAFAQFVTRESDNRWNEYKIAVKYQDSVRENLEEIVKGDDFKGRVRRTASGLSLLPLIDLVMDFDGPSVLKALDKSGLTLCSELTEHLKKRDLRAGVIVRPGPKLNNEELIGKLLEEVENGALRLTCFLLIQNCSGSKTAEEFRSLAIQRGMHACSLGWEPYSGREKLAETLRDAILTVCDPRRCFLPSHTTGVAASSSASLVSSNGN